MMLDQRWCDTVSAIFSKLPIGNVGGWGLGIIEGVRSVGFTIGKGYTAIMISAG